MKLRGSSSFPPLFLGGVHPHALAVNSGFFIIFVFVVSNGGYEATPLQAVRVPLLVGGSILHQRGRQMLSFLLTWGVLTCFTPPFVMFGLAYHDPVPWVVAFIMGFTICTSITGHWCHSLCLMYVFLLRSAATSHYLRSSPILGGCSGRCPQAECTTSHFSTPGKLYW